MKNSEKILKNINFVENGVLTSKDIKEFSNELKFKKINIK